ncbi:hypothetical protein C7S15_3919 [Burkholderia cepacia]|nr:hypothetical protein [Burkholderia cepacia]
MAADSGVLRGMIVVRSSFAMRDLSPVISLFRVASANAAGCESCRTRGHCGPRDAAQVTPACAGVFHLVHN